MDLYTLTTKTAFIILALAILYYSHRKGALDFKGFLCASACGIFIVFLSGDFWVSNFILLFVFFIAGSAATRYLCEKKACFGIAEKNGCRGVKNVIGNGGAPVIMLFLFYISNNAPGLNIPPEAFIFGYIAAISTATADTLASEIGSLSRHRPVLITTLEPQPAGTDGALSSLGTTVSLVGAAIIGIFSVFLYTSTTQYTASLNIPGSHTLFLIVAALGFAGSMIDTIVGATLQRKGFVNNHGTNFISGLICAVIGVFVYGMLVD